MPLGELNSNSQQPLRGIDGPWRLRPSPTPSMKRKKAEAILKAHGSPPHVRVTAGGRIVPSEQSPLCHPRYGYSAVQLNGGLIKFAPNHPAGKAQWMQATQNGFVAQDVNGRLCQIVDGFILPLNEVDGALRLFMHAPNLNVQNNSLPFAQAPSHVRDTPPSNQIVNHGERATSHGNSFKASPPEPSIASQISALDLEYSKREHELKDLNKSEVLHSRDMSKVAKDALVGKRRELTTTLDHIRKAIKGLKEGTQGPPAHAPTSPRAMQDSRPSMSTRGRLPNFLQQRVQHSNGSANYAPPQQSAFGAPNFGMAPQAQEVYPAPYPFAAMQQSNALSYTGGSFSAPPPALFNPPPPFFDGSNSALIVPFPDTTQGSAAQHQQSADFTTAAGQQASAAIAQNDGSRSYPDLKIPPHGESHALPIKAPERSQSKGAKSALNPMSPVYTPGKGLQPQTATHSIRDRAPTPMSPLHNSAKQANSKNQSNYSGTPITVHSPSKSLRQQSSVASFQTVDFFPRNTREYSTRKDAYPVATEASEEKENTCPQPAVSYDEDSPYTPDKPYIFKAQTTGNQKTPAGPPAIPVDGSTGASQVPLPQTVDHADWRRQMNATDPAGHREKHNLSPKSKRQDWLFVNESPSKVAQYDSSSPAEYHQCQDELCVTASPAEIIDFSDKSREYIEGFQAGVTRQSVGPDKYGQFLLGYCAGILRTKPINTGRASKGSPVKPTARRPSSIPMSSEASGRLQTDRRQSALGQADRPPMELNLRSSDTFKQAVLAPQNENAVLTPGPDGPRVGDQPLNLGSWAKARSAIQDVVSSENVAASMPRGDGGAEFPFPDPAASTERKDSVQSSRTTASSSKGKGAVAHKDHIRSSLDGKLLTPAPIFSNKTTNQLSDSRVTSAGSKFDPISTPLTRINSTTSTTTDTHPHRTYAGHRIISPHLELQKSASSIAQATGMASGFFAPAQFDGTQDPLPAPNSTDGTTELTTPPGSASGVQASSAATAVPPPTTTTSRFREASLDGLSPVSSFLPGSPPMSPSMSLVSLDRASSPSKHAGGKKESPGKSHSNNNNGHGGSPARAKFESIAGKVGIKVTTSTTTSTATVGGAKMEDGACEGASPQGKRRWRDVWKGGNGKGSKEEHGGA